MWQLMPLMNTKTMTISSWMLAWGVKVLNESQRSPYTRVWTLKWIIWVHWICKRSMKSIFLLVVIVTCIDVEIGTQFYCCKNIMRIHYLQLLDVIIYLLDVWLVITHVLIGFPLGTQGPPQSNTNIEQLYKIMRSEFFIIQKIQHKYTIICCWMLPISTYMDLLKNPYIDLFVNMSNPVLHLSILISPIL